MRSRFSAILAGLACSLVLPSSVLHAQRMYFTQDYAGISRACLDGPAVNPLETTRGPQGIALDTAGGKMYWTAVLIPVGIRRANLDGSNAETLVGRGPDGFLDNPASIALDLGAGNMYWTDKDTGKIQRANLDGSDVEDLITGLRRPNVIALDLIAGKMYWTDSILAHIQRANLDGSNIELLDETGPSGIALDVLAGKMYWIDSVHGKMRRANLDGSNVEDLGSSVRSARIALDLNSQKMYWTEYRNGRIRRANLDGSGRELIAANVEYVSGIALDLRSCGGPDCQPNGVPDECDICSGRSADCNANDTPDVCDISDGASTDCNENGVPDECEAECNANGTPDECDIASGASADCNGNDIPDECDLADGTSQDCCNDNGIPDECEPECDPSLFPGRLYWTADRTINVATREGCWAQELIADLGSPRSIAVDFFADQIYWTEAGTSMIRRAKLDGSNIEDLVTTGLESPTAIALDLVAKKMYWADDVTGKIRRANLDGSAVEDVVASSANSIAIDVVAEKLYWSMWSVVRRANLDGSGIEEVAVGFCDLRGVALDLNARKMYWAENWKLACGIFDGSGYIMRADLDGSNAEFIVGEFLGPDIDSVAIDTVANKLHWTLYGAMSRSDLDGSNIERNIAQGVQDIVVDPGCRGLDCQPNGIPDECDIASGFSADFNGNTFPDECELPPTLGASGGRYLPVTPAPIATPIALRVSSPALPCLDKYVGASGTLVEFPVFQTPADWGSVRVHGTEIIPETAYDIQAEFVGGSTSATVRATTARWGDTVGVFSRGEWTPPNGSVDITDAVAALNRFRALPLAPPLEWCDLEPQIPDGAINITDVVHILNAFVGLPYPFAGPCE